MLKTIRKTVADKLEVGNELLCAWCVRAYDIYFVPTNWVLYKLVIHNLNNHKRKSNDEVSILKWKYENEELLMMADSNVPKYVKDYCYSLVWAFIWH